MGSSFSVMRGTNTNCGIVDISYLIHHHVPCNLAKNEYPSQDSDAATVEYTMGGEHGGNNDNNMTLQDTADVGNTEQPMMGGEQGVINNDNNVP
jgi:hypothetical protein